MEYNYFSMPGIPASGANVLIYVAMVLGVECLLNGMRDQEIVKLALMIFNLYPWVYPASVCWAKGVQVSTSAQGYRLKIIQIISFNYF